MRDVIRAVIAAAAVVAATLVTATPQAAPAAQAGSNAAAQTGRLRELRGLDDLKAAFNADHGRVRIVLLLSPT